MVEVCWTEDRQGNLWHVRCQGHAGFDEELDLVCAAVSALTGALGLGFSRVLSIPSELQVGDGFFELKLSREGEQHDDFRAAQVLLRTTVLAMAEMIEHYPGYIQRQESEHL